MKRLKGINTDIDPIDQPQGSYREARNIVLKRRIGAISSEGGTALISSLPQDHEILGDVFIHDGRIVIFSRNVNTGFSEIGLFNGSSYTKILSDDDIPTSLNFQEDSFIDATSIINPDEEAIIYWTDDINPPRYLNIDNIPIISNVTDLDIFSKIESATEITLSSVNQTGGALKTGTYYFALAYIDDDNTITNFISVSTGVNIIDDIYTIQDSSIDGAESGTPTSRSITLDIHNLDTNYQRALIVAIPQINGVFGSPEILPEINFSDTSIFFTYTGQETSIDGSIDEIIIDKVNYLTAKTIEQIDGVLYMGNLTKSSEINYQNFANNIKTEAIFKRFDAETGENTLKNEAFVFLNKSFQRDEVYAFYISFIRKDGSETSAYHIPGREAIGEDATRIDAMAPMDYTNEILSIDPNAKKFHFLDTEDSYSGMQYWENTNELYPAHPNFDIYDILPDGTITPIGTLQNTPVRHHHFPQANSKPFYNKDKGETGELLGIKFKNVKIPSYILNEIIGVKFYYAKRTDQNKRLIDQAVLHPTELDGDNLIVNDVSTGLINSEIGTIVSARPFRLMREQGNIGAITHIKNIGRPQLSGLSSNSFWDGSSMDSDDWIIPDSDLIRQVESKAYVPSNIDEVELISKGFPNNANTRKEESKILLSLRNPLQVGTVDYSGIVKMQYLCNVCSHKIDVYNSFDQQELIWTGLLETNLEKFDPTGGYTSDPDAGKAKGSIDILTGTQDVGVVGTGLLEITSNNLNGLPSSGYIEIISKPTSVGVGNDFYYQFDFYGQTNLQTSLLNETTSTIQDCANAIAGALTGNTSIASDWNISVVPAGGMTYRVVFESIGVGISYDGATISSDFIRDVTAAIDVNSELFYTPSTGGVDPVASEDVQVTIGTFTTPPITILNSDSLSQIASKIAAEINNMASFKASSFSSLITVETSIFTSFYNGEIIDLTSVYLESQNVPIAGGVDTVTFRVAFLFESEVFDNGGYYFEKSVISNSTPGEVASILTSFLNIDSIWSNYYIATAVGSTIHIISKGYTSDYNGTISQVDISQVDVLSSAMVHAPNQGTDSEDGQIINLEWNGFNFSLGYDITYALGPADLGMNSMSVELYQSLDGDVWNLVSSDSFDPSGEWVSPTDDYSNTVSILSGVLTSPWIKSKVIGNCSIGYPSGADGEGSIRIQQTTNKDSGGVTSSIINISGADGSLSEPSIGESKHILNGDTFIGLYGERITESSGSKYIAYYPIESMDNINLRHQGNAYGEVYFPKTGYQTVLDLEDNDSEDDSVIWYDNIYLYNIDYSSLGTIKSAIPYSKKFEEDINFPTRIIRSDIGANNNISFENFRRFLDNDYLDLPHNRGELVKLSSANDNTLFPHMERGIFRTKGREEFAVGDVRAFIGSGDIFSVRPDEMAYTKEGRGGLQDPKTALVTPYGYFFVDRSAGKVFLAGANGLQDISSNGLSNFFFDKLRNIPNGKLIAGYDNDEERIMLTYKGNWTLSFYPDLQAWISYHDYDPEYYLSDLNGFYTVPNNISNRNIYKHNIDSNPGSFYDEIPPKEVIFEYVDNIEPTKTKQWASIEYITDVEDSSGNKIWNKTFDYYRIYNDNMDSGNRNIIVFSSLGDNSNARNIEETWKINDFRDMLVSGIIDPNKEWFKRSRITGKWVKIRFIFNNSNGNSIYLYDASTSVQLSKR